VAHLITLSCRQFTAAVAGSRTPQARIRLPLNAYREWALRHRRPPLVPRTRTVCPEWTFALPPGGAATATWKSPPSLAITVPGPAAMRLTVQNVEPGHPCPATVVPAAPGHA
jgi:hypothetical protein